MNKPLDIGETLKLGWESFTGNAVPLIVGLLLAAIVSGFTLGICAGAMIIGYNKMVLRAARGESVAIGDVFEGFQRFVPGLVFVLLAGIAISIGFMLLIIPGLVLSFMLFYAPWIMADDDDIGAIDAMKASIELFKQDVGGTIVFALVSGIISSIGGIVPFGSLVTGPVAAGMIAHGFLRVGQASQSARPMGAVA